MKRMRRKEKNPKSLEKEGSKRAGANCRGVLNKRGDHGVRASEKEEKDMGRNSVGEMHEEFGLKGGPPVKEIRERGEKEKNSTCVGGDKGIVLFGLSASTIGKKGE